MFPNTHSTQYFKQKQEYIYSKILQTFTENMFTIKDCLIDWVLCHFNLCWLFNVKSYLYIYIYIKYMISKHIL